MPISKVGSAGIKDANLSADDLAPGSVTNAKLAGSISNDKLANSSVTLNGTAVSLGGSADIGTQWQSVITADGSTNTTAVAGEGYLIDTSSANHTINLPASPSVGDSVIIVDVTQSDSNSITVGRNSSNIEGGANDYIISAARGGKEFVYSGATQGWIVSASTPGTTYIEATGGTTTTAGDFKIHAFTSTGTFTVSETSSSSANNEVDYLVVAGGGGGGRCCFNERQAGGGGAGGLRVSNSLGASSPTMSPLAATSGITVAIGTYPITVGGGGDGGTPCAPAGTEQPGHKGSDSVFSTITASGGGGGLGHSPGPPSGGPQASKEARMNGGSGGGTGMTLGPFGNGNRPPVSPPQGNNGGTGNNGPVWRAGGGGGAGAVGGSYPSTAGGVGSYVPDSDFAPPSYGTPGPVSNTRYFAGGGGAFPDGGPVAGGGAATNGSAGTANTGGGGHGHKQSNGGAGGSGIVILKYRVSG